MAQDEPECTKRFAMRVIDGAEVPNTVILVVSSFVTLGYRVFSDHVTTSDLLSGLRFREIGITWPSISITMHGKYF